MPHDNLTAAWRALQARATETRAVSLRALRDADPARGGFRRFNARVVGRLPLPRTSAAQWAALADLGQRREAADTLGGELYGLDARDQRALLRLAPHPG